MALNHLSLILIELGIIVIVLALLDRLARYIGMSTVPLFLLVGLAFGNGGLLPLDLSSGFLHIGSEIGILLLLFTLGLEYTDKQIRRGFKSALPDGIIDLMLSFPPGYLVGMLMGWSPLTAWLLGGITYISSSGIIARMIAELGWTRNGETTSVIRILVFEDLMIALYLPLTIVLLSGQSLAVATISVLVALATVGLLLFVSIHYGKAIGHLVDHESNEVVLLSVLGLILIVAGVAQQLHISAPVGAFLVGVAIKGPIAERIREILRPLRDLFAAIFFLFFGLQIDPANLPPVILPALGLGLVTTLTKFISGWWSAHRSGAGKAACIRAGSILVTHGEFSILIAGVGMAAGLESQLGAFAVVYVLFLSFLGPVMAQVVKPLSIVYKRLHI